MLKNNDMNSSDYDGILLEIQSVDEYLRDAMCLLFIKNFMRK